MGDTNTASSRHTHEPEIPPALDDEGRCRICLLLVQLADARHQQNLIGTFAENQRKEFEAEIARLRAALVDVRDNIAADTPEMWARVEDALTSRKGRG